MRPYLICGARHSAMLQTNLHAAPLGSAKFLHACSGIRDFLDILVASELVVRDGQGDHALYSNSPESAAYLVQGGELYIGDAFVLSHDRTWSVFTDLLLALQQGHLPDPPVPRIADTIYSPDAGFTEAQLHFARGIASMNTGAFRLLAAKLPDLLHTTAVRTVVDIGGSIGHFCVILAQAFPHMGFVTCDLPVLRHGAEQHIADHDLRHSISFQPINFLQEPFPNADMIIMSMVLHNWSLERKQLFLRKAYDALPADGTFLEVNSIVDNQRCRNMGGLELSLTQLVEFGHEQAFVYTAEEISEWARAIGFADTTLVPLGGAKSAVICRKRSQKEDSHR